jgi:hypothetical protein
LTHLWKNDIEISSFKEIFEVLILKDICVIPIIVSRDIWLTRNAGIFEGKVLSIVKITQQSLALMVNYKLRPKNDRVISDVYINKKMAWGFLYVACQEGVCNRYCVTHI